MHALLLLWDLSEKPPDVFEDLRRYIAQESWKRYQDRKGLRQKVWFSNPASGEFGGFYLWDNEHDMEEEIRTMHRVEAITGVAPSIHRLAIEAVQEGRHSGQDLLKVGLAWEES